MARNSKVQESPVTLRSRIVSLSVWMLLLVFVLALFLLLVSSARIILFSSNNHFTLRSVELECPPLSDEDKMRKILEEENVIVGEENLFRIDIGHLRQRIEDDFTVQNAEIQRVLPDQLKIKIVPRMPVASYRSGDAYYLLDREGLVLPYRGENLSLLPKIVDRGKSFQGLGKKIALDGQAGILLKLVNLYDSMPVSCYGEEHIAADVFKAHFITFEGRSTVRIILKEHPKYRIANGVKLLLSSERLEESLSNAVKAVVGSAKEGISIKSKIDFTPRSGWVVQ